MSAMTGISFSGTSHVKNVKDPSVDPSFNLVKLIGTIVEPIIWAIGSIYQAVKTLWDRSLDESAPSDGKIGFPQVSQTPSKSKVQQKSMYEVYDTKSHANRSWDANCSWNDFLSQKISDLKQIT